ncbi:hypothetical protein JX266_014461, partial [Neoarthrinium moseri]
MLIDSLPLVVNFDAFHLADLYLTQPVLLIAGEEAGSKWHTARLHGLLGGIAKRIIVPGAAHMDFYDNPEFVDLAVKEIAAFNCLWALVRAPNAVVHIILSPRVLDLRVPSFAGHFAKYQAKVGLRHMLDVRDTDAEEIDDLLDDEQWRDYFARDTAFQRDMHTETHLPLYMALSALRFALKFESKGHAKTRFNFY